MKQIFLFAAILCGLTFGLSAQTVTGLSLHANSVEVAYSNATKKIFPRKNMAFAYYSDSDRLEATYTVNGQSVFFGAMSLVSVSSGASTSVGKLSYIRTDFYPVASGGGGGGSGTVTSVGLSLPNIFSVSGSPVTGSGTLTGSLASQTANRFWAAPDGANGAPTFRVMVAADVPALPASKITSGVFGVAQGATGAATFTAGYLKSPGGTGAFTTSATLPPGDLAQSGASTNMGLYWNGTQYAPGWGPAPINMFTEDGSIDDPTRIITGDGADITWEAIGDELHSAENFSVNTSSTASMFATIDCRISSTGAGVVITADGASIGADAQADMHAPDVLLDATTTMRFITPDIHASDATVGMVPKLLNATSGEWEWGEDETSGGGGGVSSFNGRTGAVTPGSSDYTTTQVAEGTNQYHTTARARAAVSGTGGIQYDQATGVFSWNPLGYCVLSEEFLSAGQNGTSVTTASQTQMGPFGEQGWGRAQSGTASIAASVAPTPPDIGMLGLNIGVAGYNNVFLGAGVGLNSAGGSYSTWLADTLVFRFNMHGGQQPVATTDDYYTYAGIRARTDALTPTATTSSQSAILLSASSASANWRVIIQDEGNATATDTDTGIAWVAGTFVKLTLVCSGYSAGVSCTYKVYCNNTLVTTYTSSNTFRGKEFFPIFGATRIGTGTSTSQRACNAEFWMMKRNMSHRL